MRKLICLFQSFLIIVSINNFSMAQEATTSRMLRIALIVDGPWERNQEFFDLTKKEITDVVGGQAQISFFSDKLLVGDWTLQGVKQINDQLLADPNVDLIIGLGLIASQDLCTRGDLPKSVIAPIVIDPIRQRIPSKGGVSGVKNLSYLVYPITFERDLQLFRDIVPFKKLVNIASKRYHQVLAPHPADWMPPGVPAGVKVIQLFLDASADEVLQAIPGDADAIYLEPNLHLAPAEFKKLAQGFIERRLPSFSFLGESDVRQGIMATANGDILPRLIRRIALNVQRIVQGEAPESLSIGFSTGKRLYINFRTAYSVGVTPNWSTLLEAEMVEVDTTSVFAERLTLESAIRRALTSNLDVQAKIHEVDAESKNVAIARSNLLPKIDLSAIGFQLDKDRALAGYQPERSATAEAAVTQLLFSEPAMANLSIQSSLYKSRQNDLEVTRLNTIVDGAAGYLNFLRVQKIYFILLDNLKVTRSNLELAQVRQSTGVAGPEEPLRWEVEIANVRKNVMILHSQKNQAEYALNQILNFPLNQSIAAEDVSLDDPSFYLADKHVPGYFENPISFDILTEYMVKTGLDRSHELQQLDALIQAQQRALASTRNSYLLPTVAAFANFNNNFYKSKQPVPFALTSIPQPPEGLDPRVPLYLGQLLSVAAPKIPDRNNWTVGVQLSFNLFNGLGTYATEQKVNQQLEQLQVQRKAVAEKVALRIRYEMQNAKASYFAIQQARLQQEAAHKMLDIVTDAYSRGAVPMLNLLDAQNAALGTDLIAANALYDFFIEYMKLQRALGQFDMLVTAREREEFLNGLNRFMERSLKR